MAHLVPNPPPKNYRNASISKFTVLTKAGEAHIQVWGLPHAATNGEFMIAVDGVGLNGFGRTESQISGGAFFDLKRFIVSGLRSGDRVTVFRNTNFGTPWDGNWVPHAGFVSVSIAADHSARELAGGKLPKYAGNSNISFYPFGSLQQKPPVKEAQWLRSVTDTLDKICANALGKAIVGLVTSPIIIHPWVPNFANATSEVAFSPQTWSTPQGPGSAPDEVLLHELVHVLERNYGGYTDGWGFAFDKSDFMTVNATNVYSCLLGRGLRKDHHGFNFLPQVYFTDPQKHFNDFADNFRRAQAQTPALYNVLKTASNLWNPFKF